MIKAKIKNILKAINEAQFEDFIQRKFDQKMDLV